MVAVPQGTQNPAYAPSSAHTRRIEFSFVAKYVVRGNDQGTAGRKRSGGRRLAVSLSSKSEFAPRVGQHAERADGMEHSKRYVLCPPDIQYRADTRTAAAGVP